MERGREIVSLETALEAAVLEPSRTMVALRDRNPKLIEEAILRAKGIGDTAVILIAVTEWPGLFSGEQASPSLTCSRPSTTRPARSARPG